MLYYYAAKLSSASVEDSNDSLEDSHDADDMISINSRFQELIYSKFLHQEGPLNIFDYNIKIPSTSKYISSLKI